MCATCFTSVGVPICISGSFSFSSFFAISQRLILLVLVILKQYITYFIRTSSILQGQNSYKIIFTDVKLLTKYMRNVPKTLQEAFHFVVGHNLIAKPDQNSHQEKKGRRRIYSVLVCLLYSEIYRNE